MSLIEDVLTICYVITAIFVIPFLVTVYVPYVLSGLWMINYDSLYPFFNSGVYGVIAFGGCMLNVVIGIAWMYDEWCENIDDQKTKLVEKWSNEEVTSEDGLRYLKTKVDVVVIGFATFCNIFAISFVSIQFTSTISGLFAIFYTSLPVCFLAVIVGRAWSFVYTGMR